MRKPGSYYVTHRRGSKRDVHTIASFLSTQLDEMYEFINYMNGLGIGMFYFRTVPTMDWDEEALIQQLMQPRDETTQAPLSPDEREPCAATSGSEQYRSSRESLGKELSFR